MGERIHRAASRFIAEQALDAIEGVPSGRSEEFLSILEAAKEVFIFGRGRSGLVGRALAVRLSHLGIASYVVGETITPPVQRGDVVILLSGSGETFSVLVTARVAKDLGAKIVAITENASSSIGDLGDLVIEIPHERGGRSREFAPLGTLFEASASLYLDGIVAELMRRVGETEDSMRTRHATLE
ncbi:MAG: SIS domain-containing protein [Euryarchaeota archaeon]|nr:SIS domain-containing protein [Euryarchaeota archaeon]